MNKMLLELSAEPFLNTLPRHYVEMHRITEYLRLARSSASFGPTAVPERPHSAGCLCPCSGSFWRSPGPTAWTCTSAPPPTQHICASWWSEWTSCAPVCVHGLLSSCWAPQNRAWLCPLCTLYSGIYRHWRDLQPSQLPHRRVYLSPFINFTYSTPG